MAVFKTRVASFVVLLLLSPFGWTSNKDLQFFASSFEARPLLHHTKIHQRHTHNPARIVRGGSTSRKMAVSSFFSNAPLWQSSKVFALVNVAGFLVNLVAPRCHYHVDLFGTGAFAAAALPTLNSPNRRIQWSSTAMLAWGSKLAGFLLYRVLNQGHDARLDATLATPKGAASFWFISLLWGLVCSLPHTLGSTSTVPVKSPLFLYTGAGLFGLGLTIETLADVQKWIFKQSHPTQFCNVGVWAISQHPNWFGNLLLWSGIWVMNAPALVNHSAKGIWKYNRAVLALLGPMFMWTLFDGQATGKILGDSLEANHKRYSADPKFAEYLAQTPLIIPNPLRWFRS